MTALDLYRSLRGSIVRATGKPGAYLCVLAGEARPGDRVRALHGGGDRAGYLIGTGRVIERLDPSYAIVEFAAALLHPDRAYLEAC